MKSGTNVFAGCVLGLLVGAAALRADRQGELSASLDRIRDKYHLPALGGAVIDSSGVRLLGVCGVRKRGESVPVTTADLWHLGSDTKAMTATMMAALVEQGIISWDSTLGEVFPELGLPEPVAKITLLHLLSHRAGLPANVSWTVLAQTHSSLVEQRRTVVGQLAATPLLSTPGSTFAYSNLGYVVAAAMAEQLTGQSYEALMQRVVFEPLHMNSVGYGPTGSAGDIAEPWGHVKSGAPVQADNPLVMSPAGTIHCSLADWGKFIADQLRGAEGKHALLSPASYVRLHSAPFGGDYALGWKRVNRPWGGGIVLTHSGSNTFNLAVVWMAPKRDVATLVVCNQNGSDKACDEATQALFAFWKKDTASASPSL